MKETNVISRQQRYDFLEVIRGAFANTSIAKQVDLLKELEQKILIPVVKR